MAVQTIYLLATNGVTPNFWGNTQLNGSAPTAATAAFGWTVAKTAVTTPYRRGRWGATAVGGDTAAASSYNAGTSGPTKGTGTGASTAGDSFVAGPLTGTFAATAWTFNINFRETTTGATGHINLRVWKSANADGSSATQLLANTAGLTINTTSSTIDYNSSVSWSPGALTLNNEYLFFQIEWQETTAGTVNGSNVLFRAGPSAITTPDFIALHQGAALIAGAGSINTDTDQFYTARALLTGAGALLADASVLSTSILFRSQSSTAYASRVIDTNVAAPAGVIDGDILIAAWFIGSGNFVGAPPTPITPPAGWAQIGTNTDVQDNSGFHGQFYVYWKQAASEPSNYDFNHTGTQSTEVAIAAYDNCSGSPIEVSSSNFGTGLPGNTATALSVTTSIANSELIYLGHNWDATGTLSPPTGMVERFDHLVYIADQLQSSVGVSGDRTQTLTSNNPWSAVLLALAPSGSAVTTAWNGAALLAGAGATAFDAYAQYEAPGATLNLAGAAQLAGAAAFASTVVQVAQTSSLLTGSAAVAARAVQQIPNAALLTGVANVQSLAQQWIPVQIARAGITAFNVASSQWMQGQVALAGAGSITADLVKAVQGWNGDALLVGSAAFNIAILQWMQAQTLYQGAGSFGFPVASQRLVDAAIFTGVGALASQATQSIPTAVLFAGSSTLAVNASQWFAVSTQVSGAGAIIASAIMPNMHAAALLNNFSLFGANAAGVTLWDGRGLLTGSAAFNAIALQWLQGQGALTGAGNLAAGIDPQAARPVSGLIAAVGALAVNVNQGLADRAQFSGIGVFAVSALMPNMHAASGLSGAGTLAVDALKAGVTGGATLLTGAGGWAALATSSLIGQALIPAAGTISGLATARLPASWLGAGAGALVAAPSVNLPVQVALAGTGGFLAATDLGFRGTGVLLAASGAIVASVFELAAASFKVAGIGGTAANMTALQPIGGLLAGNGLLSVDSIHRLVLAGQIAGVGALQVTSWQIMLVTGELEGIGGLVADSYAIGAKNIFLTVVGGGRVRVDALIHHNDNAEIDTQKIAVGDFIGRATSTRFSSQQTRTAAAVTGRGSSGIRFIGQRGKTTI